MSAPSSRGGREKKRNQNLENDEMGMTQERQREIQASLFKMLGQPDEPTGNAESSSS
jgi:hypothetical protein